MRSNLFKIAKAATLGVAMAFTLSCSDDKDDGGNTSGANFSDLPKQAYFDWSEYKGNGQIELRLSDSESKPAGQIQNGQVSFNLPTSIDSKYLETDGEIKFLKPMLSAIIPEKNDCYLLPYLIKSGEKVGEADFLYLVGSGIPSPFSNGWNLIYYGEDHESPKSVTNNLLSEMGCTLGWYIRCKDELYPEG